MTYLLNIIRCKSATSNHKTELTVFEYYINRIKNTNLISSL